MTGSLKKTMNNTVCKRIEEQFTIRIIKHAGLALIKVKLNLILLIFIELELSVIIKIQ